MEINCAKENGVALITLSGRLDSVTSLAALDQLAAHVEPTQPKLILDGSLLEYVSSAGLRTLLGLAKKVRAAGGRIVIFGMKDQIREILEISGFHSIIPCHADASSARAAIAG